MSRMANRLLRSIHSEFTDQDALPFSRRDAHAFLGYALNVMHGVEAASPEADALVAWLSRNRQRLLLPDQLFTADDSNRGERDAKIPAIEPARWQSFGCTLTEQYFARGGSELSVQEGLATERALQKVTAALGFDEVDAALFGVVFRYRSDNVFERLFDGLARAQGRVGILRRYPDLFALIIGGQTKDVNIRFRADGLLLSSGAIGVDEEGDIHLAARLRSLVDQCAEANCDVRTELLGNALAAKLPWSAFSHLGREIEVARAVLGRAVASIGTDKPECGVHVLLYGPPGTGKTECAQSLAAELGVPMHVVGEQSDSGQEPSRAERLSSLLLSQRVGAGMPALYLFDEAEDLFRPRGEREPDPKIFVHRLLETARVPMIWAANDLWAFSPAVLRRMTMCIEVRLPNQTRRAALWQELAKTEGVTLDAKTAGRLARMVPSAPSVARTALRATRLGDGDAETAALVASGMARAIGHGRAVPPEPEQATNYDPALSNADTDLADLMARLTRPGAPAAISLLLSGPPGTGKTAFARHLAGCMGLEVLQKRGSDLFGPYVGQTEANIAAAFAEARATGAFLLFDEADSLLFDRSNAVRGWELSQVNEMLTWMEQHNLPFACTTNLAERLDKASLRRFLIRLNFDFLLPHQAALLFRRMFGLEPPAGLARLDRLTPADFSRIARRCDALGLVIDPATALDKLGAEIEGRDGAARAIGFARQGGR
jgi:transitional endoplasmic reticulum ATPase